MYATTVTFLLVTFSWTSDFSECTEDLQLLKQIIVDMNI